MISIQDGELRLGGKIIFSSLNWRVDTTDRIGLVGPNGSGKTSLLRVLVGEYALEAGNRERSRNLFLGYLPQESSDQPRCTVSEALWEAFEPLNRMEREMHSLLQVIEESPSGDPEHEKALLRYGELQEAFQHGGGYSREAEAKKVMLGLGFKLEDWDRPVEEFSGGWRMRLYLAKLILQKPDQLLLDEPTNHLDPEALFWFENYLASTPVGLVIVSHDRFFLDRVVTQVAEIEYGRFRTYSGNYSEYRRQKEIQREQMLAQKRNQDREIAHLESFVERFKAKATKATQAQSRVKRLEKIERIEIEENHKRVSIPLPPIPRSGHEVLRVENLGHCYGELRALQPVTATIVRGNRIGVWGPNGAGKSTLLSLMAHEMEPTEGTVQWGHNTHVAYFSQHHAELQESNRNILDELSSVAPPAMQTRLRDMLGAFLFSGDDVFKQVSVCSGGEKSRIALAKLLIRPVNVLILDEPLNHLDISTVETLEETLRNFEGTLIFVSHDRYFIERLATHVWELNAGRVRIYTGSFSDYEYMKTVQKQAEIDETLAGVSVSAQAASGPTAKEERKEQKRLEAEERKRQGKIRREKEQRCKAAEERIHEAEEEIVDIETRMADPQTVRNGEEMARLSRRHKELLADKEILYEEWEKALEEMEGST